MFLDGFSLYVKHAIQRLVIHRRPIDEIVNKGTAQDALGTLHGSVPGSGFKGYNG
jgi:hypothetical protein